MTEFFQALGIGTAFLLVSIIFAGSIILAIYLCTEGASRSARVFGYLLAVAIVLGVTLAIGYATLHDNQRNSNKEVPVAVIEYSQ